MMPDTFRGHRQGLCDRRDEQALAHARLTSYSAKETEGVPVEAARARLRADKRVSQ
jgi:hypothetical protein